MQNRGDYMPIYIKGNFKRSIFRSDSGYIIGIFKVLETNSDDLNIYVDRTITFTGYFHELNEVDTYILYGSLVVHDRYGEQFQVESYERCLPEEKDSVISFLSSGIFKGIGLKKAKKIVDVLGDDTLKIILEQPNNLLLIPTITSSNVSVLHNKLKEYENSYDTIIYLNKIGFNSREAMLIYNYYKDKTIGIIDGDIYKIVNDVSEINFKRVDYIAIKNGVAKDDIIRVRASILYVMNEVSNLYGHSFYFEKEIYGFICKLLMINIDSTLFIDALSSLETDLMIVKDGEKYYLRDMYDAECLIATSLLMLSNKKDKDILDIDKYIDIIEKNINIEYNEYQKLAIRMSALKHFLIITGGPGTGKTTIMRAIVELYKEINHLSYSELQEKIALVAPTGRAAKRISETTVLKASTIHRFLKWQKDLNKFQINEYNKSKVEFIIIDEASMIDTYLMSNLLKGLSKKCRIVIIGDEEQLPSVGAGQVLHDLIASNMLNVVKLEQLYRQGKDSNIITLAYDVRKGFIDKSIFNKDFDLTFIECNEENVIHNLRDVSSTYIDLSYKNFQVLVPMYKGLYGIDEINNNLKNIFNKSDKSKKEIKVGDVSFREGDKVIQLTNMPEENIYNGDIGIISRIVCSSKKEIYIDYDGNVVKFTQANFNKFRLAYAISIHKAQGSEFDVVVIPIVKNYNKMLYRKLIYTAITRCKSKLYLIGDIEALNLAIKNVSNDNRRTSIKNFLINGIK